MDLKARCDQLRPTMTEALALIADDVDGDFEVQGMTYDPESGTVAVKVMFAARQDGKAVDPRLAKFRANWTRCWLSDGEYTLPADALGRTFERSGRTYTVAGWNSRARKTPVVCTTPDGKQWRWEAASVAYHLDIPKMDNTLKAAADA